MSRTGRLGRCQLTPGDCLARHGSVRSLVSGLPLGLEFLYPVVGSGSADPDLKEGSPNTSGDFNCFTVLSWAAFFFGYSSFMANEDIFRLSTGSV